MVLVISEKSLLGQKHVSGKCFWVQNMSVQNCYSVQNMSVENVTQSLVIVYLNLLEAANSIKIWQGQIPTS